jgi:SNF2 family DNA or RNA helicase
VSGIARRIVEPLCEETGRMLTPVALGPHDRMRVSLNEDGTRFVLQPYARMPDGSAHDASWNARNKWFESVPEREQLSAYPCRWEAAVTDVTSLVIDANWPPERLDWETEARAIHDSLLLRFMQQTMNSLLKAKFRERGEVPPLPEGWLDSQEKPLARYQTVAALTSYDGEGNALFMEQGTGKTPTAIAVICNEAREHHATELERTRGARGKSARRTLYKVLVVCPKNVRQNWVNEISSFCTVAGKVNVLRGGKLTRMKTWMDTITVSPDDRDSMFAVCIVSYESVKRSWDFLGSMQWDRVILDESHYIKSVHRDRGKSMLALRDVSDRRLILTGTPVTNSVMDLYMQLEFLGQGMSGFSSWEKFRHFYGVWMRTGNSQYEKLVSVQNLPFLKERLARVAFQVSKRDALPDLPDKAYQVREVEMSPRQHKRYVELQSQLALEIEEGLSGDGSRRMTATNILTKLLRLAQITSGFYAWDQVVDPDSGETLREGRIEREEPNPKIEAMMSVLTDPAEVAEHEKAIVWACFIPDVERICEELAKRGIPHVRFTGSTSDVDRAEAERRFNQQHARDCKVFVGNPAAGGVGLNLRGWDPNMGEQDHGCNCTHVMYYSQNWSMVHRAQSEDRAHRRGTREPVTYWDFVVPGSIDEEIRARVTMKQVNAAGIQDVREIMKRVLETVPDAE